MDNISSSTLLFGVAIATAVMLLVLLVSSPSSSVVAPLARFWATLVGRVRLAFDCYCYNNNPTNSYNWSSGWIRSSAGSTGSSINSINISSIGKNTVIQVSALFVHPVKSLGGIPCQSTVLDSKGIIGDRRYMLVTPSPLPLCGSFGPNEATHRFLTQRHCPVLARVRVAIGPTQQNKEDNGSGPQQKQMVFTVNLPNSTNNSSFVSTKCTIHAQPAPNAPLYRASVWGDACLVQDMGDAVADFFQRVLTSSSSSGDDNDNGTQFSSVRCVMQHETDDRTAKDRFVPPAARTLLMGRNPSVSLADGFPLYVKSISQPHQQNTSSIVVVAATLLMYSY